MKTIFSYVVMALAIVGMFACTPKHDKTVANLKAAIDGEATASAKYTAFAEQAAKDSLYAVEALFKATAQAEAIHIQNHQAVLAQLEVTDYVPTVQAFEVKTTAENLQAGIDGETYEFETMYPGFIADAESEKVQGALVSFNYALDAEKDHAKIYGELLAQVATPEAMATIFYVCPKCGFVYVGAPVESCELCQTAGDQFIISEAVVPVATEAEAAK